MAKTNERHDCPWCSRRRSCVLSRMHDEGTEFRCRRCDRRHTRKEGHPGECFLLFPGDIYRMFTNDVKPLFLPD